MRVKSILSLLGAGLFAAPLVATNEFEPNDARSDLNVITFTVPDTVSGGLPQGFGGDNVGIPKDFWAFAATSGQTYSFSATLSNTSFAFPIDIGIDVENASGGLEIFADANGDNLGETMNWPCGSSGTYYLVIHEATGTPNNFAAYSVAVSTAAAVGDWSLY